MPSPSNLYAEKVYAEQPSGLWSLDEDVDYIQILTDDDRNFDNWVVIQPIPGSDNDPIIQSGISLYDAPLPNTITNKITSNISSLPANQPTEAFALVSPFIDISGLNPDEETFSIATFLKSSTAEALDFVELGYEYYPEGLPAVKVTKTFESFVKNKYMFLAGTFDLPEGVSEIKIYLKIGMFTFDGDHSFEINGMTLGQNAEEFHSESTGVTLIDLPSEIALSGYQAITAFTYGIESNPGYYLSDGTLYAQNSGVPLVYGSGSTTKLYPNSSGPSLILPAMGLLHADGKYRQQTFEAWLRLTPTSHAERRIIGPIASDDGLYVEGPFLKIKIGETYGSHYVGEWGRPMLIDLRVGPKFASLLLNGEEVISVSINADTIDYPERYDDGGFDQEWIGFYAYSDISPIELDCVAIYNYIVPNTVAKRRWVYGQAVDFPENINKAYSGSSVLFDYQFADYSNNYNYPDIGSWNNGVSDGLIVSARSISTPAYDLPRIVVDNESAWKTNNSLIQEEDVSPFFVMSPAGSENPNNRIEINRVGDIVSGARSFYGVFETISTLVDVETLITLLNVENGNYFKISLQESRIDYVAGINGVEYITYSAKQFAQDELFVVGLDIPKAIKSLGSYAATVLGNFKSLKMIIGNNHFGTEQFSGRVFNIGLCSPENYAKISDLFLANGTVIGQESYNPAFDIPGTGVDYDGGSPLSAASVFDADDILSDTTTIALSIVDSHSATYEINIDLDPTYRLIVSSSGNWKDYVPLSYLAENVTTKSGNVSYEIDFIQFNIGYPALPDIENAFVRSYVSFHPINSSIISESANYSNVVNVPSNGVVQPGDEWINTKYEIVDNTIINIPKSVDVKSLAMVMHIDIDVRNANESPIKISKLQLASQTLNYSSSTTVGTKFGIPAYPYSKTGVYYDFKANNPYTIYKGSTPYLYLTNKSGVTIKGDFQEGQDRGIAVPINQYRVASYETIAMQLAIRHDQSTFDSSEIGVQVFAIESNNLTIRFFLQSMNSSNTKARIYAINSRTGEVLNGISYYQNGKIVKNPVIRPQEWNMIGIGFPTFLDFNGYTGYIFINGPLTVSNISHYESTAVQQSQTTAKRAWTNVLYSKNNLLSWDFWATGNFSWYEILILSEVDYYGVDPRDIYDAYVGTNKIITGDETPLRLHNESYNMLTNVMLTSTIVTPV